ncbi:hypothetical protein [Bosea sp. (in: a-proteobacteria)]|jgi:hypothetical protein|uniref:hypothetical protein n=1 Tax=Bosea sp. (in: a-proteobacteria) TaxID=1871050 RepID=UPI003F6F4927
MDDDMTPAGIGRFLRNFGGQVAMSLAVSAATAGLLAFPDLLLGRQDRVPAPDIVAGEASSELPASAASKFLERHLSQLNAEGEDAASSRPALALPAALMMPLSIAWTAPVQAAPVVPVADQRSSPPVVVAKAVAREPARVNAPLRPLLISPPVQVAAASQEQTSPGPLPGAVGRAVSQGVTLAGDTLGGIANRVGAAGTWTVSAATALVPSW